MAILAGPPAAAPRQPIAASRHLGRACGRCLWAWPSGIASLSSGRAGLPGERSYQVEPVTSWAAFQVGWAFGNDDDLWLLLADNYNEVATGQTTKRTKLTKNAQRTAWRFLRG
ncbi:MAG: hypothetical protein PHS80_10685 [Methanothrix sp.]|nr:hypothetical protein [Methanothrix sp.]MDD4448871.1 hypothetical protein [Methanothrix sp.]